MYNRHVKSQFNLLKHSSIFVRYNNGLNLSELLFRVWKVGRVQGYCHDGEINCLVSGGWEDSIMHANLATWSCHDCEANNWQDNISMLCDLALKLWWQEAIKSQNIKTMVIRNAVSNLFSLSTYKKKKHRKGCDQLIVTAVKWTLAHANNILIPGTVKLPVYIRD